VEWLNVLIPPMPNKVYHFRLVFSRFMVGAKHTLSCIGIHRFYSRHSLVYLTNMMQHSCFFCLCLIYFVLAHQHLLSHLLQLYETQTLSYQSCMKKSTNVRAKFIRVPYTLHWTAWFESIELHACRTYHMHGCYPNHM
jgi:hypothetical protein